MNYDKYIVITIKYKTKKILKLVLHLRRLDTRRK